MIWTTQIPEQPGIYWAISKTAMDAGLIAGPIVAMCTPIDGVVEIINFLGAPEHWHVQGRRSMDDWLWGDAIEVPAIPLALLN